MSDQRVRDQSISSLSRTKESISRAHRIPGYGKAETAARNSQRGGSAAARGEYPRKFSVSRQRLNPIYRSLPNLTQLRWEPEQLHRPCLGVVPEDGWQHRGSKNNKQQNTDDEQNVIIWLLPSNDGGLVS